MKSESSLLCVRVASIGYMCTQHLHIVQPLHTQAAPHLLLHKHYSEGHRRCSKEDEWGLPTNLSYVRNIALCGIDLRIDGNGLNLLGCVVFDYSCIHFRTCCSSQIERCEPTSILENRRLDNWWTTTFLDFTEKTSWKTRADTTNTDSGS